jgi:opacity protein-like surface antigen
MKKIVILLTFFLIPLPSAQAQLIKGYGFKAGIAITNQDFNSIMGVDFDFKNRFGFDFGGYIEWFDLRFFSMLTEAHYVQKGMIHELTITSFPQPYLEETVKLNNRVDYLSFPILAKMTYQTDKISPYFFVGPRFDFLLDYRSEWHLWDQIYRKFKDVDIGLDVGIGTEVKFTSKLTILAEFRFSPDVTYAYKTKALKVKNNSFEILTGARF